MTLEEFDLYCRICAKDRKLDAKWQDTYCTIRAQIADRVMDGRLKTPEDAAALLMLWSSRLNSASRTVLPQYAPGLGETAWIYQQMANDLRLPYETWHDNWLATRQEGTTHAER